MPDISSINIPIKLTQIGANAFYASSLTTLDIPETVLDISDWAFGGCEKLTELSVNAKIIHNNVFNNCKALQKVTIKELVHTIGNGVFLNDTELSTLVIDDSEFVLNIGYGTDNNSGGVICGKSTFNDSPLDYVYIGRKMSYNTAQRYGFSPFANNLSITTAHLGRLVETVQSYLMRGCLNFKTMIYEEGCHPTSIDSYAFRQCVALTENDIKFPTSVTSFGEGVFYDCVNLLGYTIPGHVKSVGANAFRNCEKLANVIVQPGVTSIGNYAFSGCTALKAMTFEEGEEILTLGYASDGGSNNSTGRGLFYDCPLDTIFLGRNLSYNTAQRYGYSPFANNNTLAGVKFGNPLRTIQTNLVRGCANFTTMHYNQNCKPTEIEPYAFRYCTSLKESDIHYPTSVNKIGDYAFSYCTSLEGYTIPGNVQNVGVGAFYGCDKLYNVIVQPGVTSIGNYAFSGCTALKAMTFEEGEEILTLGYASDGGSNNSTGRGLFYDCPLDTIFLGRNLSYNTAQRYGYSPFASNNTLAGVKFGNPLRTIQTNLVRGCANFTTMHYNQNCKPTEIEPYAFRYCTSLKESDIHYPTSVNKIGDYAFSYCTSLEGYTIPGNVQNVGVGAFYGCDKLYNVIVQPGVMSIGNYAFNECPALKQLTFEEGEEILTLGYGSDGGSNSSTGRGLFYNCPLESAFIGRNLSYYTAQRYGYSPFANHATFAEAKLGNPLTSIPANIFRGCSKLASIIYNQNCKPTSIGSYAFAGCSSLTEEILNLPKSIKNINEGAFYQCNGLTSFTVNSNVNSIGNYAFNGCSVLEKLIIEEGDEILTLGYGNDSGSSSSTGKGIFTSCPIVDVYIGRPMSYNSTRRYGYSPFANNDSIVNVTFCKNLKTVQTSCFSLCDKLANVTFEAGSEITEIESNAFDQCQSLPFVELPNTVRKIGSSAFYGCKRIQEFSIGSNVTDIGNYAFSGCSELKGIIIPANVTSIGNEAFNNCTSMKSLHISEGTGTLSLGYGRDSGSSSSTGDGLFSKQPLNHVFIGRDLSYSTDKRYGYAPFCNNDSLRSAEIGHLVETLKTNYFCLSDSLETVTFEEGSMLRTIANNVFDQCGSLCDIEIPELVESMGNYAFNKCASLKKFTIGKNVNSVGNGVFNGCTGITKITMEDANTTLTLGYGQDGGSSNSTGKGLFYDCPLEEAYIGRNLSYNKETRYGQSPLAFCDKLRLVEFGENVNTVQGQFLRSCTALTDVFMTNSIHTLSKSSFIYCSALEHLQLSENITTLGDYVFYGCEKLSDLNLPSTLTGIGEYCFGECRGLTSMTIPSKVTNIANYAFFLCSGITELNIEDGEETLVLGYGTSKGKNYGLFNDCPLEYLYRGRSVNYSNGSTYGYSPFAKISTLKRTAMGDAVVGLGEYCYYGCTALEQVILSHTISNIKSNAFANCSSLTHIYLPPSVQTIACDAFAGCSMLNSIYCFPVNPPTISGSTKLTSSVADNCKIYVLEDIPYLNNSTWKNYANILIGMGQFTHEFTFNNEPHTISYTTDFPISVESKETEVNAGTYNIHLDLSYMVDDIERCDPFIYQYTIGKATQTIVYDGFEEELFVDNTVRIPAHATSGLELRAKSNNENIASIFIEDGDLYLVCKQEGTVKITLYQDGNINYYEAEPISFDVNISLNTGINGVLADPENVQGIYTLDGKKVEKIHQGVYVIRMKDGSTRKFIAK